MCVEQLSHRFWHWLYLKIFCFGADRPSAPGLTVTPGNDLQSFDFTITPPTPSDCVVNYTITATGSDGSVATITVPASGMGRSASNFDLCTNTYSFTVAAVTNGGNGATSSSVTFLSDVSGKHAIHTPTL